MNSKTLETDRSCQRDLLPTGRTRTARAIRCSVGLLVLAIVHVSNTAHAQPAIHRPDLEVQIGHQHQVDHAVFGEDSRLLATADIRGGVRIWDTATGKQLRALSGGGPSVSALAFSPDGRWLASAGAERRSAQPSDRSVIIQIWEVATGKPVHRLMGHRGTVTSLAFTRDGTRLATAGDDVKVWDTVSGRQVERLDAGSQTSLAFSPDGRVLAVREPSRLRLWALGRSALATFPLTNSYGLRSIVFRPDGARLAVPDGDRLKVIEPPARRIVADLPFHHESEVLGFVDDHCVVRSRAAYELWDISSGTRLRALAPRQGSLDGRYHALSPDLRRLVALTGPVTVRDIAWNRPPVELTNRVGAAGAVAFSPDGSLLATKTGARFWIWDLRTGEPRRHGTYSEIEALAFTGDGRGIISGDWFWNIIEWDVASGQARTTVALKRDSGSTVTYACSADGRWCVSGQPGRIDVWDVERWRIVRTLQTGVIRNVAISEDGSWIAAARIPQDVDVWRRDDGEHRRLSGHAVDVSRVAFAPGGRWLASADFGGTVRRWDVVAARETKVFDAGHENGVTSLAFSPDGQTLATGGTDHTIKLWDVTTDGLRHVLHGHADWVAKLAFSPNGKVLASGSGDGTTRLWDVERGIELAVLVATSGEPDWLVGTPAGLFDGSASLVAWRVGTSAYPAEGHLDPFRRRGLLATLWRGETLAPGGTLATLPPPPGARIMRASGTTVRQPRLPLRIRVEGAAAKLRVYRNLALMITRSRNPSGSSEYVVDVELAPGETEIRAVAVSPAGKPGPPDAIRVFRDAAPSTKR